MNWIKAFWKRLTTPLPAATRVSVQPRSNVTSQTQRVAAADEAMSNFTPRAQQVLSLARKEADRFHHNFVGTEHLLLGIVALGQGTAVAALTWIMFLKFLGELNTLQREVGSMKRLQAETAVELAALLAAILARAFKGEL
jgi:ATP-dependent Clp protease ATP-binding subunit ClpA